MEDNRDNIPPADDAEATLVTPRFDDEATLIAQRVEPLKDAPQTPQPSPHAPAYAPRRAAKSPNSTIWLVGGLAAIAAIGLLLAGAFGFYLYRSRQPAVTATPEASPPAVATASPSPTVEESTASAPPANEREDQPIAGDTGRGSRLPADEAERDEAPIDEDDPEWPGDGRASRDERRRRSERRDRDDRVGRDGDEERGNRGRRGRRGGDEQEDDPARDTPQRRAERARERMERETQRIRDRIRDTLPLPPPPF